MDHYNGLQYAAVNQSPQGHFGIREVYYPGIPHFDQAKELCNCLLAINLRVLGYETGMMAGDFLNLVWRINRRPFIYTPLFKGRKVDIGGAALEVLWPPSVLDDDETISILRKAIRAFNEALEFDPELERLHERVNAQGLFDVYFPEAKEHIGNYYPRERDGDEVEGREISEQLPGVVQRANRALCKAANHISLAFFQDKMMLFWGDTAGPEIRQILSDLKGKDRKAFHVVISPHHGTHWDESLRQIRSVYTISSNGKKTCSRLVPYYKEISLQALATHANGDITLPIFPWRCF
jgi:hypothetical protein